MRSALESFGADRPLPPPAAARGSTTGADCRNCPFATKEGLPNRPVCGEGPEDPLWIVVGEGPGHNEQIFGRPFIGASGAVMDKILASLGRPRQDIWIANATLCRPYDGADEKVRDRAAQACRERLRLELARFPGKPILSVGAPAARVLIPHAFGDRGDTAPKTAKQAAAQAMTAVTQAAQAGTLAVDTRTRAEVQAERREAAKQRKLDAIAARRAAREAAKTAKASGAVVIKLGPLARVDKPKKTIKIKAPKLPKPPKPPKARRPKGVSKGKGLSFSDLVSTLHMTPFVGEGDIRLVIPTIHPAALLRAGAKPLKGAHGADLVYWNLLYDAGKLDALARGVDCRFTEDGETEVADSVRATRLVLDIVAEARACGELAVDLETHVFDEQRHHALMMYVAQIKAIGLATPSRGVSVMWDLLGPTAKAAIGSALGDPKIVTVYHNGLYDRTVLRARGFNLADEYADTLLAHHATFPGMAHKLQYVAGQFFAIRPWKSEFRDGDETPEALTKYNMYDVLSTARLRAPLEILVKKTKTEKVYEIDRCMGTIASHMHLWGVPMSRDVNEQLLVQFRDNVKQAREAIEAVANDPDTLEQIKHRIAIEEAYTKRKNDPEDYRERQLTRVAQIEQKIAKGKWAWSVDKTTHVVGLLQALGVNLVTKTASGRTATSKAILDALVDVPIVRRIVNYRENAKLLSTFVWAIFDRYHADGTIRTYGFADEEDRVHPSWSITKISGRWASTEPVLSNVPKADAKKGRPNLRAQVVAPPGRVFVGFDFCLAQGTLIDTPDGHRSIESLKPGDLVYSFNNTTKRPACSKITGVKFTGYRETLKVILDNGQEVRCTPDHRWLTKPWGIGPGYVETQAQDLVPGTRLLPLRRGAAGPAASRYETLYSYSAFQYEKTHLAVARAVFGEIPDGHHVHHKDGNRVNNKPDNLEVVREALHLSAHGEANASAQWRRPTVRAKMVAGIKASIKARGGHHGSKNPNAGRQTGVTGNCPQCGCETYLGGKRPKRFCSQTCFKAWRKATKGQFPRGTKFNDLNHKVVAVVRDGIVVPTWDIEVERDHNFALAAGVFVHNCQLEARGIALVSGDPWLCDVFAQGKDIHTEAMKVVWGEKIIQLKDVDKARFKVLRDAVKRFEYGAFYGGSVETLWKTLLKDDQNVKYNDVAAAVYKLMGAMPLVTKWQDDAVATASKPPNEIRSRILGRRRVFPLAADRSEAINIGIQSLGADIMDTGMWRMWQKLPKYDGTCFPILQIHDAAVFECNEDDADRVKADVNDAFTQEYGGIPFPIEIDIAYDWAGV